MFRNTLHSVLLLNLIHTLSPTHAVQNFEPRLAKQGEEGSLNPFQRWKDAIGTALRIHGRTQKFRIITAMRDGPSSKVYRDALSSNFVSQKCEPNKGKTCQVAENGFGTIGEVKYNSELYSLKLKARSTQVMVSCRCLDIECGVAVLVRPVVIVKMGAEDIKVGKTCLYERAENGKFSDCYGEFLRVTYRDEEQKPLMHGKDYFNYTAVSKNDEWTAVGQRGWTDRCHENTVAVLRRVNLSGIAKEEVSFKKQNLIDKTLVANPEFSCVPPEGVEYVIDEDDEDGDLCGQLVDYASGKGAHLGTQQDGIATGQIEKTFMKEKPVLVSNTELTLTCSAAGLGVMFVWGVYRKQMKRKGGWWKLTFAVVAQILAYMLEALPLHTALWAEVSAREWKSLYAFVDATLVVAKDTDETQGNAAGSVMVLTGVIGEVWYAKTRVGLVSGLTALFDILTVGIIVTMFVTKAMRIMRMRGAEEHVEERIEKGKDSWTDSVVGESWDESGMWSTGSLGEMVGENTK